MHIHCSIWFEIPVSYVHVCRCIYVYMDTVWRVYFVGEFRDTVFTCNIFVHSNRSAKFAKIFSHKINPLYSIFLHDYVYMFRAF